jgi:molecular chaperone Hsp33
VADAGAAGQLRRFLVEHHPVRGHQVDLGGAWQALRAVHAYPAAVETLLGEAVAAVVLLAATLKFRGRLTLQFTGHGAVSLLVAQCTHDFRLRAVAQHEAQVPPLADFATLVGDGRLAVTVESGEGGRYQGIVPLAAGGIGASLEAYFASSEQLPTVLRLHALGGRAAGLLLQRLPSQADGEAAAARAGEVWEGLCARLQGLPADLLLQPAELLLPKIGGELDCRLFAGTPVAFHCGCGEGRVAQMLRSLGAAELRDIVREQGAVTVHCEFCRRAYRFDAIDVEGLIGGQDPGAGGAARPN